MLVLRLLEFADELVQLQTAVFLQILKTDYNFFLRSQGFHRFINSDAAALHPKHLFQSFLKGSFRSLDLEQVLRCLNLPLPEIVLLLAEVLKEILTTTQVD